jgi:hypothetical protein
MSEPDRAPDWSFTNWIQIGRDRWQRLDRAFWRVPAETKRLRYDTCKACDRFVAATSQCRECWCAMGIKTWFGAFSCPLGKWQAEEPPDLDEHL